MRANRRLLLKGGAALTLGGLTLGRLGDLAAAQDESKLEIFSWLTSPGEAPALQALFDAFNAKYPDVEVINAAVAGGGGGAAQAVLQTRLQGNNPPDSWQTHIGRELIDQYVVPGYCLPISDIYEQEGFLEVMPQGLVEQASWESEQYSVPIGVHRGNGLFYNKSVLQDAGIAPPEKLAIDDFFAAADALKAKGVTGLALGSKDAFVPAQTFENVLLGVVGPETYRKLFAGEQPWDDPGVREAGDVLAHMLDYVNPDHSALTWDEAFALVIEGKAGMNTMGDWAWGEVIAKKAEDAIGWLNFPGTDGSFVLVVDSFPLPKGAPHPENSANWLRVIGSKEAQEAFNLLKGSIPARTDTDKSIFGPYHQWSMESFAKDELVPSCAHGQASSPQFKQALYDAATSFLVDRDVDALVVALSDAAAIDAENAS
ncbi:MAG: carbohydrate ABC transporter substrate-binding protein [Thermomicrobiales bacterium]|nr:carbohydrate ABC transporter substrate-binding protein [Thermomicrobiales bacterium]